MGDTILRLQGPEEVIKRATNDHGTMQQLLPVTWTDIFIAPPLDCVLYCKECGPQELGDIEI